MRNNRLAVTNTNVVTPDTYASECGSGQKEFILKQKEKEDTANELSKTDRKGQIDHCWHA